METRLQGSNLFFKWAILGLCLVYFCSFQTNNTNYTINVIKYPFSTWYWDPNSRPLELKSSPLTTRLVITCSSLASTKMYSYGVNTKNLCPCSPSTFRSKILKNRSKKFKVSSSYFNKFQISKFIGSTQLSNYSHLPHFP